MKSTIEARGFTNVHEKIYKVPMGAWTKNRILKDAGRINKEHFLAGMEGYSMYVLNVREWDYANDIQVRSDEVWIAEAVDAGGGPGSLGPGQEGAQQ